MTVFIVGSCNSTAGNRPVAVELFNPLGCLLHAHGLNDLIKFTV